MGNKLFEGPNRRSFLRYLESAEYRLNHLERETQVEWTPGQVLGALLSYVDRLENFTASTISAAWAQKRMQWLMEALSASAQRSIAIGLDPHRLDGIFDALRKHDAFLSAERDLTASKVKEARNMVRLEIFLFDHE